MNRGLSMTFKVIDESDVMRATDRLVDRIRQYQQSKIYLLLSFYSHRHREHFMQYNSRFSHRVVDYPTICGIN